MSKNGASAAINSNAEVFFRFTFVAFFSQEVLYFCELPNHLYVAPIS
jgi:hypothetical protein